MVSSLGGAASKDKGGKAKTGKDSVQTITKEKEMNLKGDDALILRHALRDEQGKDRDVFAEYAKLLRFNKNGVDVTFEYKCETTPQVKKWAFKTSKASLSGLYEASGYGWVDEEKKDELADKATRLVLIRKTVLRDDAKKEESTGEGATDKENKESNTPPQGELVGFAHIGFSLQGEVMDAMEGAPSLFVYDLQIADKALRRKGLAKYLMTLLEMVARKYNLRTVTVPLVKGNPAALGFFKSLKGYSVDKVYGEDDVQMILSKHFQPAPAPAAKAPVPATTPSAPAAQPAQVPAEAKSAPSVSPRDEKDDQLD